MQNGNINENRIEKLVESLESISARLLEVSTANNQIATSQTPEMRALFDRWLQCLSEEILAIVETNGEIDVASFAQGLGLSPSSAVSLLLSLERGGKIDIKSITASPGDGKNREICGCLRM